MKGAGSSKTPFLTKNKKERNGMASITAVRISNGTKTKLLCI
jgi:hypothetical protein